MSLDPIGLIANIGGSLTSSITLTRFLFDIKNAEGDVKTCLSLVQTVERSLEHLIHLRNKHLDYLSTNPLALQRVDAIVASTTQGILDVGRLLEGCRAEAYEGRIPLNQKMKWVLGNSSAFSTRTRNMTEQHAAVNAEIAYLRQIEILQPLHVLVENTTFENLDVMNRKKKRASRGDVPNQSIHGGLDPTNLGAELNSENPPPYEAHLPNQGDTDMEENEDPEIAWYREMRRREEARRRRRA